MEYNNISSIPAQNNIDTPKIILFSHNKLFIENYKGVVLYSPDKIEINTKDHLLIISGKNLSIKYMIKEELQIIGTIEKIELNN